MYMYITDNFFRFESKMSVIFCSGLGLLPETLYEAECLQCAESIYIYIYEQIIGNYFKPF